MKAYISVHFYLLKTIYKLRVEKNPPATRVSMKQAKYNLRIKFQNLPFYEKNYFSRNN